MGYAYSCLDIVDTNSSREVRDSCEVRGSRQNIRAVDERGGVGAELTHRLEDELEAVLQLGLVR